MLANKNLPNIISISRILGTIWLLLMKPLTTLFMVVYTITGVTDVLDGAIARHYDTTSETGARLDSIADLLFYTLILIRIFPVMWVTLPKTIWIVVAAILIIRFISYTTFAVKRHAFASLHTYWNKFTGLMVFGVAYFIRTKIAVPYCWTVVAVAMIASLRELGMHLTSRYGKRGAVAAGAGAGAAAGSAADVVTGGADPEGAAADTAYTDYVWYLSYGSNMLYDRFMHYIRGGSFVNGGACHEPCRDQSEPIDKSNYEIPYDMYYANESGPWGGMGVSFIDTSKPGRALGVAYLVTREQYWHVVIQENNGKRPEDNPHWYDKVVSLGDFRGHEVMTFTNHDRLPSNEPSEAYLDTLARGLRENYPEMSDEEIRDYLESCKK
ncbi:MAG: CDP-alcohol phosphatidyltransferase family protein [Firmicutes bacterium]|nr:CDP-alcohol phosphatidyltransferase family protein [Bacillota bacterium]